MTKLIKEKNFFQITCEKKSIKEVENGLQIEGYASTKDKDRGHDIVEPTAFKSALELYMTNPIVLLQHNMEKPIGTVTEARIDEKGLYIKANITEDEDGIFSKLKNGVIRAFSIGYRVKDFEDKEVHDSDGELIGYETVIKDLELFEISLVSIPMNQYALMKSMQDCFEKAVEVEENTSSDVEQNAENVEESNEVDNLSTDDNEQPLEESTNTEEVEVQEEEKSVDENELLENNNSQEAVSEGEDNLDEKIDENLDEKVEEPSQEAEEERKSEIPNFLENADENSEIALDEEVAQSENDTETVSDDETAVDEISNTEEVVEKAMKFEEAKSFDYQMKFEDLSMEVKSLRADLDKKNEEISTLNQKLGASVKLLEKFAECLEDIDSKMSSTIVQSGFAYRTPVKKVSAYSSLIEKIRQ